MNKQDKILLTDTKEVLLAMGYEHTIIQEISYNESLIKLVLLLPYHKEQADIEEFMYNMKEEFNAIDVKIEKREGKRITILFGMKDLSEIKFRKELITNNTLQIKLPTSFGYHTLDFEDGASCHMLNGGAPRMGKTIFLLYTATLLYIQTKGNIDLYITSTKGKDFYPLMNLPNVQVSDENESEETFLLTLLTLRDEYKRRNTLLYSSTLAKATDSKSVKQFYPHMYHHFKPIFLIIDEYARFNKKEIHILVTELVQTAGYVNVHVIIATQRPDARNTLPANIKMGLMTRICFRTADKNNSIVILDDEGAETLPNIKGRAILKDGDNHIIQVPHITYEQCTELLQAYKKESTTNETTTNQKDQRSTNNELTNKIQDLFKESDSEINLFTEHQPNKRLQPNNEAPVNGWFRLASKTIKG